MKIADIRQHALKLLNSSKEFFAEDGDLDSTALIITADDQFVRPIELGEEADKIESCKKIVDEALRQKALAIITIFLARSADFDKECFEQENYTWGDIQDSEADRSILITLSGPGIKNWAVALPFKKVKGEIVFGELVEFAEGVDLGLFPGWTEEAANPSVS